MIKKRFIFSCIIMFISSFCIGMSDSPPFTGFFTSQTIKIPVLKTIEENKQSSIANYLELGPKDFTEEILSKKADLHLVESLKIRSWPSPAEINDRELVRLMGIFFRKLRHLTIVMILTDTGFNELAESHLALQLESLSLLGNMRFYLTAASFSLENIARFITLKELTLKGQHRIDDECFVALARSQVAALLEKLCICACGITGASLTAQELERFTHLEELHAGDIIKTEIAQKYFLRSLTESSICSRLKKVHVGQIRLNKHFLDLIESCCYITKR